jgi:hypothetical protein
LHAGRLQSYGDEYPTIKALLEQLLETCTKTRHLLPLFSCLDLGGPEISRKSFESPVRSLAASNASAAGTRVICGLENGSIIIYDLDTGT